ncbi:MAG TPA: SGNH/GDSL hydrolase family protein [Acidimicrobiia bacterium]|nr:SGNH/GDSL hydrolase family protein [Acidimicrobiia bacterium]
MTTPVVKALQFGAKTIRKVAGHNNALERFVRHRYLKSLQDKTKKETGPGYVQYSGGTFVVLKSTKNPEQRAGIILRGGCDLPSVFLSATFIREDLKGTVAIYKDVFGGQAGASTTSQMLQTLDGIPREHLEEGRRVLRLGPRTFEPHLFEPGEFTIQGFPEYGTFPKSVIVLSTGSDLSRTLHRHKEHGYLVDIGGWWLNESLEKAIHNKQALDWFKRNFESVGKIKVEDYYKNMEKMVTRLRERTGAHVVVLNSLVIDPLKPVHNYQLLNQAHSRRRRDFHLALVELSAKLNFHIVDVDRGLKRHGVREQVDFAHFPIEGMMPIAKQAYRIFKELEVV